MWFGAYHNSATLYPCFTAHLYNLRRYSGCNRICRNISSDDCTRTYHGAFANMDTIKNNHTGSQPDIIINYDIAPGHER